MSDSRWTPSQREAIDYRGSSVLVSAAAGSGKTAVLVERVIKRIIEDGIRADKFLIVTFTKAAAGELRSRIMQAIDNEMKNADDDKRQWLVMQKNYLPLAKICTIDSFTGYLVKENVQSLGISSAFSVMTEEEQKLVKEDISKDIMREAYENPEPFGGQAFYDYVEQVSEARNNENARELFVMLNDAGSAYPYFEQWIDGLFETFSSSKNLKDSVIGKLYNEYVGVNADLRLSKALRLVNEAITITDAAHCTDLCNIRVFKNKVEDFCKALAESDYKKAKLIAGESFRWSNKATKGSDEYSILKSVQDNQFKKAKAEYDSTKKIKLYTNEEFISQREKLLPVIETLVKLTKCYHCRLMEYKREHNRFTFDDILHFAVELVSTPTDDPEVYEPTPFVLEFRKKFEEICIDEFQDTSKTQCLLFESLSRNNLFMVGDIKQSIYRFRKAQPQIFNSIRQTGRLSGGEHVQVITLGNNFRSRTAVTESTNFVFENIMSKEMGEVDYNEDEKLIQSRQFDAADESVEFHILNQKAVSADEDEEELGKVEIQASYIADLIKKMIDDGFTVQDKNGMRPCRLSDFCVLARTVKVIGPALVAELKKRSLDSFIEIDSEFFKSYEIDLILSIVKIVNNPGQDIPLAATMMSVLYGFTPDEMTEIRLKDNNRVSLYSRLLTQQDENPKIKHFLDDVKRWRNMSMTMNAEAFLRAVYDDTGIENYVELMPSPVVKRANLSLLLHYASKYESEGNFGVSNFLRYTEKLKESKLDYVGSLDKSNSADVVRIMTIHKSKGLQAPVVILAMLEKNMKKNQGDAYLFSNATGFGFKYKETDEELNVNYYTDTVSHTATKYDENKLSVSEEMRILYVAMTRAEEKLILVSSVNYESTSGNTVNLKNYSKISDECEPLKPVVAGNCKCYLDWLVYSFLRHPDAANLREECGCEDIELIENPGFKLDVYLQREIEVSSEEEKVNESNCEPDSALVEIIREAVDYKYKYAEIAMQPGKISASDATVQTVDNPYFAASKPAFLTGGYTAAQRGTITHKFMQYVDFNAVTTENGEVFGVEEEMFRLVEKKIMTSDEADAVEIKKVKQFFLSDLARRMKASPLLMREKKFTVYFDIDYFNPELAKFRSDEDKLTMQGIADAVFVEDGKLVIVDYKTDRLENEEDFIRHYESQIKVYKNALVQCTDYDEVSAMVLYSFYLGKEITVG